MSISAKWYVLVTSAGKAHEFATMGPYPTKTDAVHAADVARVPHYRVKRSGAKPILVRR
jgi:hypothetical protein